MEYTVQGLAQLAGISTRTIRYYDEINILKPARFNSSGYRIYGQTEVECLQQIMFYRELGVSLDTIKDIVTSPSFNRTEALKEHHHKLLEEKKQLEKLITNVEKSIALSEGRINMSDLEKFEGFKHNMFKENELKFGKEIREKYGENTIEQSNAKLMKMKQKDYNKMVMIEQEMFKCLAEALSTGDPASELAQKSADLHRQWLSFHWAQYSKEAHAGLAQMYVDDERFKAYYDEKQAGLAEFLRDAILSYTGISMNE